MTAIHRVLVCGATGRQGGAVSRALLAHGFEVLALTRSPQAAAAKELERLGAQVVVGDLSQPVSLHPIMQGVDAVFSVQNCWERGVGAEGELRPGPLPFTTLGTVWFMDNILDPKIGGSQSRTNSGIGSARPSPSSSFCGSVDGLRPTCGKVLAYIWNQGDGFPSEKQKTLTIAEVAIRDGQAEVDVQVPASEQRLAVSVMHDENGNGKMDSNVLGIPLEGYATSNNVPHSMIGPPRYKDAEFEMRASAADVHIKMLYWHDAAAHDRGRTHSTRNVTG